MNDDRIAEIESKIAFQEQAMAELNQVVYEQQQQIEVLETRLQALTGQLKTALENMPAETEQDERPPHF